MSHTTLPVRALVPALAGLAIACGGDIFSPTTANVAGTYAATTFTTTTAGVTTNQLAAGASLTITLAVNGTVTGQLFIPGAGEDGGNFIADMAGTWTLSGSTVDFAQTADSFVRDVSFIASENQLTGDATFSGTAIHLELTK